MTIAKKLIFIIIIIVIFILSISIYLSESFKITIEKTIAQNVSVIAEEILKRIDYNFQILVEDLYLYSTHDYIIAYFAQEKLKYNVKNIADSLYVSEKLKERFFKYWRANRGYQLFNSVHIIDLKGNIISSTEEPLINKKIEINKLLDKLEQFKFNISEIFYNKKNNDYIISLSILIKNEDGENKGIIQADISFLSFIKEVEINLELYDLSQLIIVCNEQKKLGFKSGSFNMLEDVSKEKYFNYIKFDKGYFTIKENNQKYIYSYAKKSDKYTWLPDWSVIIKNSEKEVLSPIKIIVIRSYLIIFILIIILFISIMLLVRNILSSVKNLQAGAKIIGDGNLSYKIKSISKDELNEVAISFNKMTENLKKVTANKNELQNEINKSKNMQEEIKSLAKFPSENPNPVLRINKEGKLLYANGSAFSIFSDWNLKIESRVPEILQKLIKKVFAKQKSMTVDIPYNKFFFSIAISPLKDLNYVNMYFIDITERKHAESIIKKLNIELEERVKRRTAQLEASNKELEAFAYSVSHDLRTPLRSISGFSQALLKEYTNKLDEEGKDYLNRIQNSSQLIGKLIDDLLSLSKITRFEMQYQKIDLTIMVKLIVDEIKKNNSYRKIDILINQVPEVKSDMKMLNIAMINLIHNAWKFTKKNPNPKIEFGFSKNKGEIIYFIKDNGAGFDMVYADKLFVAFQRLHTQKEFPGTGIGLALVKRIFNMLGGRIWTEAEIGKGAVFYFVLSKGGNK